MSKYKSYYTEYSLLIIIVLFFISNLVIIFFQENVWWDAAVYAGMGKYIFSLGNAGLWEASRPIIWPLILGFFWKLNLDVILFGKIVSLIFSIGVLLMTFLIAKEIFDKKVALLSTILLALTPTFFFFSSIMLTGIPSTFFGLLAVYFFIKKKYFFVGLFSGLAFMTRFLQLGIFIILFIILLLSYKKEKNIFKKILKTLNGFLLVVLPYLIFNYFMYNSILHPFLYQVFLTKTTGWMLYESWFYYFFNLFRENFISIFSLVGLFFIFKKIENKKIILSSILILFFIFFTIIKHKEIRFAIVFLPYLYLISSYGLIEIFKKIKSKKVVFSFLFILMILFFIQGSIQIFLMHNLEENKENRFQVFQAYLNKKEVIDGIWISNPIFAVYSDKKIDEIVYRLLFSVGKERLDKDNVNHILLNTCDIPCNPRYINCPSEKADFMEKIKNSFEQVYYNEYGECEQYIFRR